MLSSVKIAVAAGMVLYVGLSPILPARAQGDPPPQARARAVIRTNENGVVTEHVIDLDPSQLSPLGEGNNVIIMRAGPNGEISTFSGSPDMVNFGGGGGLAYNLPGSGGPNGGPYAGLTIIDPGVSYLYALLKRTDIGTEIRLNARQREALEAAETSQQQARQDQLKQSVQGFNISIDGSNKDDLRTAMADKIAKMQDQAKSFTDNRLKALASILRPEQMARLKELDYQYRGPLAMGMHDVATLATLNNDLATKVTGLYKEYKQEIAKNLPGGPRVVSFKQGGNAAPPATGPPPNSEEMRGRLVKADKEIRKARVLLGAKALATIPDAQRAQWSKLTGKPFEFHPAL